MSSEPIARIFIAETGVDVPSVSADQMRELDRIAIEETGPSLLQMMENAGRNLALLAMELMGPHWRKATVLTLAGNGGNGGGGICAARHLSNHGVTVDLCLAAPESLSDAALAQRSMFRFTNGRELTCGELDSLKPDLIIDSLIGYGLRARPHGTVEELVTWSNRSRIPVLSLDIPRSRRYQRRCTWGIHPSHLDDESCPSQVRITCSKHRSTLPCRYRNPNCNSSPGDAELHPAVRQAVLDWAEGWAYRDTGMIAQGRSNVPATVPGGATRRPSSAREKGFAERKKSEFFRVAS